MSVFVRELTKRYGDRVALDGVSFEVGAGTFAAILGPSGAGKTTLLRCLVNAVSADGGEAEVAGHAMQALSGRALARARRDVGFVFQQFNLVRRRSALENAAAGRLAETPLWRVALGRFRRADLREAAEALDRVGLAGREWQRADTLSGGQRQRVAIARALTQRARVILADEPVASLDPETAKGVLRLLRELAHERGVTVLCSLHQQDLARRHADMIVTLEPPDGRGAR